MREIALITTGGTIEKTYDEQTGELLNRRSIVRRMLSELHLEETAVRVVELMSKDSLEMTDADRRSILEAVRANGGDRDVDRGEAAGDGKADGNAAGIVVLHGTDTLERTGELLAAEIGRPRVAIVLTGALRPFEMRQSDALQNLTEAIFAAGLLPPGIYCVAHGRAMPFPGVRKDRDRGTFVHL
ncbi:MAG TPA: asparaginase domain-containing protein [Thermoanaerobaculia bacterium]|nr:asparaginase domain-containing protein [Thermoanaerobaculia bacterium]